MSDLNEEHGGGGRKKQNNKHGVISDYLKKTYGTNIQDISEISETESFKFINEYMIGSQDREVTIQFNKVENILYNFGPVSQIQIPITDASYTFLEHDDIQSKLLKELVPTDILEVTFGFNAGSNKWGIIKIDDSLSLLPDQKYNIKYAQSSVNKDVKTPAEFRNMIKAKQQQINNRLKEEEKKEEWKAKRQKSEEEKKEERMKDIEERAEAKRQKSEDKLQDAAKEADTKKAEEAAKKAEEADAKQAEVAENETAKRTEEEAAKKRAEVDKQAEEVANKAKEADAKQAEVAENEAAKRTEEEADAKQAVFILQTMQKHLYILISEEHFSTIGATIKTATKFYNDFNETKINLPDKITKSLDNAVTRLNTYDDNNNIIFGNTQTNMKEHAVGLYIIIDRIIKFIQGLTETFEPIVKVEDIKSRISSAIQERNHDQGNYAPTATKEEIDKLVKNTKIEYESYNYFDKTENKKKKVAWVGGRKTQKRNKKKRPNNCLFRKSVKNRK